MAGSLRPLIALAALAGVAGCAYQDPLQYPTYGSGGGSYSPYYFGGGSGGYSPYFGYGATDPYFYYRGGYPAYGYYPYPQYPVYYCVDANRDGRCDRRTRDHDDNDHDGDHDQDGDHDVRGSGGNVTGTGRVRDHQGRLVPRDERRDPERFVPGTRANERQVPHTNSNPNRGAAGMVPRTLPSPPRQEPVAPRGSQRTDDDPSTPSPGFRPADHR